MCTNLPKLGTGELLKVSESVSCWETVKNPVNEASGDGRMCEKRKIRDSYSFSLYNGERGSENCLARKLLEKAKSSPKKFVLPSKSIHSARAIIPNKRFTERMEGSLKKRSSEEHEMMKKSHHKSGSYHKVPLPLEKGYLGIQGNYLSVFHFKPVLHYVMLFKVRQE